jgi:4'-phosphopantetheinyl transferase
VDVEQIRHLKDLDTLVNHEFSAAELAVFETLPADSRSEAFFHAWVRKEAFLKATGEGLSRPLADIEVSFAPRESARVLAVSGDTHASRRWSMIALTPRAGFVGAIVAEAPAIEMAFHRFHGSTGLRQRHQRNTSHHGFAHPCNVARWRSVTLLR